MGYLKTRDGEAMREAPSFWTGWIAANELNLAGVEIPLTSRVPSFNGADRGNAGAFPANLADELKSAGLKLVADYGALLDYDAQHTKDYLDLAARYGAKVVRAILSHLLCGDRRKMAGGWDAHRDALAARLRELLPYAARAGPCPRARKPSGRHNRRFLVAVRADGAVARFRRHPGYGQPALRSGRTRSRRRATGSPDPAHPHEGLHAPLRPEGYRLVRCAAGDGVIDFPAILAILRAERPRPAAGHRDRRAADAHGSLLEDGLVGVIPRPNCDGTAARPASAVGEGRPQDEPYSSAWERGENSAAVRQEEWDVLARSTRYFASI